MSFVGGSLNLKKDKGGVQKKKRKGKKKGKDITADALPAASADEQHYKVLPGSSKCVYFFF
jgi:hypothetical protein